MGLPDSQYTKTMLLPFLTTGNKQLRYAWARQFWVFWESAKTFHASVQVALVHMDEKWFWAVVVRRNLKYIPFFGCSPIIHGFSTSPISIRLWG